ncbi:hypothetical protein CCACVL1_29203 [Corchorus capsularis]|uniref:At2g35280-like TPR domain-containing protein n=1 Tax=Corchorus capsularis TaxID=210143 RepID=A0A1R3G3C6_COCAP|nr:hypothetical protein CCACVL1_29203 [Corchorus capsularis]
MGASRSTTNITCIPEDIIAQILTRVIKNSPTDFANATIAWKAAWEVNKSFNLFKNFDLAEIPPLPSRRVEIKLVIRCARNGNIDALFRYGLEIFFRGWCFEEISFFDIRRAYDGGHMAAGYMLGVILVFCCGASCMEEGIEILSDLKVERKSNPINEIWHYRSRGYHVLSHLRGVLRCQEYPVEDRNCDRCKRCKVHDITKAKGVCCPLPNRCSNQNEMRVHPEAWQFHIDIPDPLDGGGNLALVTIPERVGFALELRMHPLNSVVCRLVQMQATLLECATDPSRLIAAWKDSPLQLDLEHIHCRVKPVDLLIDAGEVKLFRALIDPDVDNSVIVDVSMKLLKNSGSLGYKVKMTSGRQMHLIEKEQDDTTEVTSKVSQKEEAVKVTVNPFGVIAVMIWNCKGYKQAQFHVGVREIVAKYHPSVLIITNSRISCKDGKQAIDPRPFKSYHVVEPVLGCGGALILWNADEVFVSFHMWNYVGFTTEVSSTPTPYIQLL